MKASPVALAGTPARIFVSVDERTGRSTLSFAPREVGQPIVADGDARGEQAITTARAIAAAHAGCVVDGPHFHTSRPPGSPKPRRGR
jgi:hypothetical protein